jgi:hypothetical protein
MLSRKYFWRFIIARLKPKVVVGISLHKSLCYFAKKNNAIVIELYHGFGRGAANTVYFQRFEDPSLSSTWPDSIILYDFQSYSVLSARLQNKTDLALARNYWDDFMNCVPSSYFDDLLGRIKNQASRFDHVVLISLQHGYDGSRSHLSGILDNGLIHEQVLRLIRDTPDVLFLIKPHPVQLARSDWKKKRLIFVNLESSCENVEFNSVESLDIVSALSVSDAHITMSSGCIYEAGMLGVPSIGLCPTLQKGGVMADAFSFSEDRGLLERGVLNSSDLDEFMKKIILRTPFKKLATEENVGLSAADIVAKQLEKIA